MTIRTGIEPNALVAAPVTAFGMTAKCGRAARFNGNHDAALCGGLTMRGTLTIVCAVAAKHVRHFRLAAITSLESALLWSGNAVASMGRGRDPADWSPNTPSSLRSADTFAWSTNSGAHQELNGADVGSVFQHMDRKRVPKAMRVMGLEMRQRRYAF